MGDRRALFSLRTKLFLAFFLLSAFITLAISYTLFVHMRTNHLDTLKRDLAVIAGLAAEQEDGKIIGRMADAAEHGPAVYQAVSDLQQRLKENRLNITGVYVWRVTPAGEVVHWLESGDVDPDKPEAALAAAGLLPAAVTRPVVMEVSGRNLAIVAYTPVRDAKGTTVALLGLEIDGTAVAEDVRHFAWQVFSVAALAVVSVGLLSWWLARNFTRRLSRLHKAMDEMAAGNLDIALPERGQDEIALLASRLNQLAITLSSEREEMLLSAIESLVAALEAKDTYTYGHSSQVSIIAHTVARQIGLGEQDLFSVRIAALLHDIGKIGIPDQVLNKPGRLDEAERRLIEQHPEIGAKILAGIPALARVTEMVRHHHARWDGTGYPAALAGEEIPLGARIIAVADTYQAMTSDRPYRKGLAPELALAELRRCAGSQFDPALVAAFAQAWQQQAGIFR